MSDQKVFEDVLSLEDIFLSHDFGRPRVEVDPLFRADATLFGGVPPRGPLVPLAATAALGAVGHSTTTHQRQIQTRRRAVAALSGVVAALLAAVGVGALGGHSGPTTSGGGVATKNNPGGPGGGGGGHHGGKTPKTNPTSPTQPTPPVAGSQPVNLASLTTNGKTTGTGNPPTVIKITGNGPPVTITVTPTPTGQPAPTSGGSDLLTSVVVLVGHVASTAGDTVTVASDGLGDSLPVIGGVTNILGNVGGGVNGLGETLASVRI